jgi:hypothetical protein
VEERPHGFARDITLILKLGAMATRDLDAVAVGHLG